ncbi:MAG: exonuclease SbcCD subunit D [Anaerolineales bacterium]|jgi:exonuclease SbcD
MATILHFADAHIDMANYGRHDPQSGLPVRVMDFLKSLDIIVDTAIEEGVDLVLFAGDAFKDRNPAPTFQREWGKRIMRLSRAEIPTILLVGNHDLSPALGRAHALEAFDTLEVPHIQVVDRPAFLTPDDLEGIPLQVIAVPWVSRSGLMAYLEISFHDTIDIFEQMGERLIGLIDDWIEQADPDIPLVLSAHCSVEGAQYGSERKVMLGKELVLPGSVVRDPRLDYTALGHIHKAQNLNEGRHPPVVYPGSIERLDFGEKDDQKVFVIAHVERGNTTVELRTLDHTRPFFDRFIPLESKENITEHILSKLPKQDELEGSIFRIVLEYPRDWEALVDESTLAQYASGCFEFHLVKRPKTDTRVRLPEDQNVSGMGPLELLDLYLRANHIDPADRKILRGIAAEIFNVQRQDGE